MNMGQKLKIEPHRITKPIQLLAAWLTGLVLVDGSFLFAASQITKPGWICGALVIASIANVPIFLIAIFLLQTKFRPEMQEDSYYSKYLETKTGHTEREITTESVASIRQDIASLEKIVTEKVLRSEKGEKLEETGWSSVTVALNKMLHNSPQIGKKLADHGIPVHQFFGSGAKSPMVFSIAIGRGFTVNQIKNLVNALQDIPDSWISFAHDDRGIQYDNQVLIGAYGAYQHGIRLSTIKPMLQRKDITIEEIYRALGKDA